ncbi:right-handed parallel beta-helix repeat-containing protein [Sphingobium yanoikuyae]|uniref:right-handed parallel beta-helix repeat-containing protein n=1 Tax=Sphingobium yanoikuyae TaxID=13690 RepID=UPI0028A65BCC|nr:right-handed parallel beta-helix repeat-containing protein [Sphingobium yanoikuyae]
MLTLRTLPLICSVAIFAAIPATAHAATGNGPGGARCDGRTDDAAALNRAVQALPAGGTLTLPSGRICAVGSPILLKRSGLKIVGKNTTLRRIGTTSALRIDGNNNSVSGITVDGSAAGKGSGILVTGSGNQLVNVAAVNNQGHGIGFDGQQSNCSRNILRNSRATNNGAVGIAQNTCTYNKILNNRSTGNGAEGITADHKSDHATISGNILSGNVTRGGVGAIGIDFADGVIVTDNRIGRNVKAVPAIRTQNNQGPSRNLRIAANVADANPAGCVDLMTGTGGPTSASVVSNNRCAGGLVSVGKGGAGNSLRANGGSIRDEGTGTRR